MKKTLLLLLICALSFSAWSTTVVKTVPDLTTQLGWKDDGTNPLGVYPNFALDDNISVSALGTTNGTLSKQRWFTYQNDNNGAFTISAKEGYIIQTISIQYGVGNTGVLSSKITATLPTALADQIATGTPVVVNAPSATFYVGNTGNATNGRLTINAFAVTYCLSSAIGDKTYTEKFDSCGLTDKNYVTGPTKIAGNDNVYKWALKQYRRQQGTASDELSVGQGIRISYGGYIQSDGDFEGGIKSVAFNWRPTSGSYISDFYVKVGGTEPYHHNSSAVSGEFPFSYDFNVAKNTTLSIEVAAQMTPQQAYQVIGPVTITPYLLFTKKNLEYQYTATQSLDLSTIIINNTGTTPSYTISEGAEATIAGSVVTFANKEESFTVTATWGEVSTTTTIAVHALPVPNFSIDGLIDGKMTKSMYDGTFAPTPIVKIGEEPVASPVVTYTSSDENIVSGGTGSITILAAGSVTITANLAASDTYQAAETTFTLNVIGIQEGDANKVIESYSNVPNYYSVWSSSTEPVEFDGDNTPYAWEVFYYKHDASKSDLDVNGAAGVMLAGKSAGSGYISATIEGGVKAVAFDWKIYTGKKNITAELYAGATLLKTMSYSNLTAGTTNRYECALEQKSNVVLKVRNNSENNVYGPITIVPYLLYTVKSAEMWAKDGVYTNSNLINNTGETPSFTLEDNDGEATIDAATGAVTALKDGEVTVKASWNEGKVYTTYTLKLHLEAPNASFAASEVEKSIGDEVFINELTKSEYAGTVSYSSSDETVATVNETTGEVTIVNGGTAKITASIAASAICRDTSLYYTVDVKDTPVEGTYWEETFSKCTTESTTGTESVIGDLAVYNWSLTNFQRNTSDMVGGKQGMRLRYPSVWTMTDPEGGIKEVVFDWIASGREMPVHFFIAAGTNEYEYTRDKVGVNNKIMHFARQFNETSNVALTLHMSGAEENPPQTYAVVGPIKIVPYLLFTKKNLEYQYTATQSLDLSTIIINNTGTTPSYTISEGAEATIAGSVVTFANKEESFTVTATWGEVSTTTTIAVHALPVPDFSIDGLIDGKMTKSMYDGTFAPTPIVKIGEEPVASPVVTYTSSDENIVKVENEGKVLSILAAGEVTITANLAASETHQAATTTFTLDVTGIEEGDANKVIESYTKLTQSGGWSSSSEPVEFEGDNTPYLWKAFYYQYYPTNQKLNINDAAGVMLATGTGYLSATIEGGVKAIAFDWKIYEGKNSITAELYAGETLLKTMSYANLTAGTTNHYECALGQKSNVEIKLLNKSQNDVYGPITIVPYLLYTEKEANANLADETYINEKLINNTDEGDITYSIVEETDIATIDETTGVVTLLASGTITVQAQWGDVTTSYSLTINRTDFTPTFAQDEVTKNMDDPVFTNTLSNVPEDATGERTYSSSNERVAQVDNNGQVTILGVGSTTIEVTIAEDAKYNETSASYALTVNEPATGYDVTEGFTGLKWVLDDTELKGDLCDWTTSQTRRNQSSDSIVSKGVKMGAEWMYGAAGSFGYIQSKAAVDGGVKRIYFTWEKTPGTEANRSFKVTVGDVEDVVDLTGLQKGTYWHNFNIRENSVIRIDNNSASNFKAGPIVITPYIFYQHRADTIMASSYVYPTVYKQTLIDNTESVGTITYESDNTDAAEVNENGDVTIKAAAAEPVTITAKWQPDMAVEHYVTTSYKLLITAKQQRNAEFTNSTMTVARGETPVNDIILGSPAGDSEPEIIYESSDNEVAVIVDHQVTTVGPGTATITAHIGETTKCLPQDITYSLTVTYEPAAGTYFTETFPNTTTTGYTTKTEHINGLDNVYQWNMQQYRRIASDKVGEEQGTRIRYTTEEPIEGGYIEMDGNQEGGIKEVNFNYCAAGSGMQIHYYVQVGENVHDFHPAGTSVGAKKMQYAHDFNVKSNTQLRIYLNTQETPQQTYPIIGEIKITPYLLYTRKDTTINLADYTESTFINDKLIDNRDEDEVAIVYSIIGDDGVASIDAATGEVTPLKAGTVTVQAAWTPTGAETAVSTTYNLTIEPSTTLISEDDEDLAELVAAKAGETLDITLKRTMAADGAYSTIFLPFAMNPDQIAAVFGGGTQVAQLLNSELQDNVLTFNFDFVTEMSACVPYLIKPTQNVTEVTIEGVTIVKPQDPVTVEGGKFNGILAKQVDMDITDLYFLGDDNVLVTYPNIEKQDVQGLRAFFTLTNPIPNMVARCAVGHKLPTVLPFVDGKPVAGVKKVIINNQMVIIRNAEMYNAQGNKIQ